VSSDSSYPKVKQLMNMGFTRLWIDDDFEGYIQFDGTSHYDIFTKEGAIIGSFCPHGLGHIKEGEIYDSSPTTITEKEE